MTSGKKECELKDEWETFSIRFSVYTPSNDESDQMRIIGSVPELTKSGNMGSGPKPMKRSKRQYKWLN